MNVRRAVVPVGAAVVLLAAVALGPNAVAVDSSPGDRVAVTNGSLAVDGSLGVSVHEDDGWRTPFDAPVPGTGADAIPTDPDGDGQYEDVDGDGTFRFLDVVALLFADYGSINDDRAARAALDFDGSGRVGFLDVVALLFEL